VTIPAARYETLRAAADRCSIRETLCPCSSARGAAAARVGSACDRAASPASHRRSPSKLRLSGAQVVRVSARIAGTRRTSCRSARTRGSPRPEALEEGDVSGLQALVVARGGTIAGAAATQPQEAAPVRRERLEPRRSNATVAFVKALENPLFETIHAHRGTVARRGGRARGTRLVRAARRRRVRVSSGSKSAAGRRFGGGASIRAGGGRRRARAGEKTECARRSHVACSPAVGGRTVLRCLREGRQ